jgi:hypothetical protein
MCGVHDPDSMAVMLVLRQATFATNRARVAALHNRRSVLSSSGPPSIRVSGTDRTFVLIRRCLLDSH